MKLTTKHVKSLGRIARGVFGLLVSALCVKIMVELDGSTYRNSVLIFSLVFAVGAGFFIYGMAKLISASEHISNAFVRFVVTANKFGTPTARRNTVGYALRKFDQEKKFTPKTPMVMSLVVLAILLALFAVMILVGGSIILRYGGWIAASAISVFLIFAVVSDYK